MKRFTILAALIALVGCAQYSEELDKIAAPTQNQTEFYASMPECDTRTYVEDNKYLRWNSGDEITIFNGNSYNSHWKFAGENGANSGKFTEVEEDGFVTGTPLNLTANYAIYPYDENITITESGVVSLTLPATQAYNHAYANSFGAGANTMMAVTENASDNFLSFKNLCGYLKLKFYGNDVTVKSVTIKGNNSEKIAGNATVTMTYGSEPTITMGNDATDTITINCGEGVTLSNDSENPTTFWVVIPETTFEGGITITVTDTNDQTFTKATTNAVPITNNMIQPMAALEVECEVPIDPENCKIYYTATAKVEPCSKDVFGANIISNEWYETTSQGVITFDGEVSQIGHYAFYCCENLTGITIPDSVTSIGYKAFLHCSNLDYIDIGNSVISIGSAAFAECGLRGFVIPDHVTLLEDEVFAACKELKSVSIGNGINSIPDNAFAGCDSLEFVSLSNSIVSIGSEAFYNCSSLVNITIPSNVTSIEKSAFSGCSSLTNITIPDGVTTIKADAFKDCINLVTLTNGRKLNDVDSNAFNGCTSLPIIDNIKYAGGIAVEVVDKTQTSYTLKDDTYVIANAVFFDCINATSISLPSDIVSIGGNAFYNCENLQNITLPEGLEFIGSYAFRYCDGLSSITIPSTVETIKEGAFNGCRNLSEFNGKYVRDKCCVIIDGMLISYAIACDLSEYIIPNDVTTIATSAFEYCSNLLDITIPDSVTSIETYAFSRCTGIQNITIPNSVTTIKYGAFQKCLSLSKVYCKPNIPPTVKSNYESIFGENASDRKIYVPTQSVNLYKTATGWKTYASYIVGYDF